MIAAAASRSSNTRTNTTVGKRFQVGVLDPCDDDGPQHLAERVSTWFGCVAILAIGLFRCAITSRPRRRPIVRPEHKGDPVPSESGNASYTEAAATLRPPARRPTRA